MSDHADHTHGDTTEPSDFRQTAPQGPYTNRMVGIGMVVALVGLLVVFGLPILLTL